jgi:CRP-like cAMP-binding protein
MVMEEVTPFFIFLNKFVELSVDEFAEYIQPYIVVRRFDAKEVVSAAGAVEDYFNYLVKGLAFTYHKKDDAEMVVQIATEGHIIHAQESFHSRKPSLFCVEAIEPSTFVSITYADLESIYASSNKMQHLGRLVVTFTMLLKEKAQLLSATLSPRERFQQYMDKYPAVLQRVPQKYIASYLGVQPETFSRFKRLLREQKME